MLRRFVLLILLSILGATALAADPAPPREKPAEFSTVGSAPAVLTDADQAKYTDSLRRLATQRVQLSAARAPGPWFAAPPAFAKEPDFETRIPSLGIRNRMKPVEPVPVPAAIERGGRP